MEIALCIIAASYFAFAFRDVQSVVYIAAVAYVLHMFINHPSLFSNGPATPTASIDIDEQAPAPASHRQTRLPEPSATATAAPPLSETPTPITITPSSLSSRSSRSSRSSPHPQAQGKPSRYTFDPINGGVVHPVDSSSFGSPRGSPRPTPTSAVTSCSTLASPSPSALRRPHRIPDISAGRSPILPVRSVSPPPLSYTPNEHAEPGPAAQAEMAEMPSQIVHTEMVARPKLTLETIHTTPAEKATHRRMGSHRHHSHHTHHTHHHSHSRSHHRQRSSRSPVSFSDATGSCDPDYDSDSSRASTSSTRSTTSSYRSHGLPSYEKHVRFNAAPPRLCFPYWAM